MHEHGWILKLKLEYVGTGSQRNVKFTRADMMRDPASIKDQERKASVSQAGYTPQNSTPPTEPVVADLPEQPVGPEKLPLDPPSLDKLPRCASNCRCRRGSSKRQEGPQKPPILLHRAPNNLGD